MNMHESLYVFMNICMGAYMHICSVYVDIYVCRQEYVYI